MTQNIELEIKVIKKFINKDKQNRYIQFVSLHKNRHKFISDLSHFNFLNWNLFDDVNGDEGKIIINALQKNHVDCKSCYVISENVDIDTKTLGAKEAIKETVGSGMGTILVFGDAEMIFYECETMNTRFISKIVNQTF